MYLLRHTQSEVLATKLNNKLVHIRSRCDYHRRFCGLQLDAVKNSLDTLFCVTGKDAQSKFLYRLTFSIRQFGICHSNANPRQLRKQSAKTHFKSDTPYIYSEHENYSIIYPTIKHIEPLLLTDLALLSREQINHLLTTDQRFMANDTKLSDRTPEQNISKMNLTQCHNGLTNILTFQSQWD